MTTNGGDPPCPPGHRGPRLCDFFQRTRYYRIMPKYHAVRIRQEQRYQPGGLLPRRRRKKLWVTKWQEPDKYY